MDRFWENLCRLLCDFPEKWNCDSAQNTSVNETVETSSLLWSFDISDGKGHVFVVPIHRTQSREWLTRQISVKFQNVSTLAQLINSCAILLLTRPKDNQREHFSTRRAPPEHPRVAFDISDATGRWWAQLLFEVVLLNRWKETHWTRWPRTFMAKQHLRKLHKQGICPKWRHRLSGRWKFPLSIWLNRLLSNSSFNGVLRKSFGRTAIYLFSFTRQRRKFTTETSILGLMTAQVDAKCAKWVKEGRSST